MTDETVMRAVLAMDAYHRGSSIGIDLPNGDPDVTGTQLGEASIIMTARDASTGFYAIAFELNGETVISYQGTDESIDYLAWFGGGGFDLRAKSPPILRRVRWLICDLMRPAFAVSVSMRTRPV